MTRADRRWCMSLSLLLMVLTSIPYLVGFQTQSADWTYTGFVFGVGDGNSYIAKMLQGQSGAWLFRTPYSSVESDGVLAFLPYLLLGKLAGGEELHSQLAVLFHLARLALIPVLVLSVYRFAAVFLAENAWRRWATALAVVGGGLGWLLSLTGNGQAFGSLPLDLYSPESFGFLAVYGLPHLMLARALLLVSLTAYLNPDGGLRSGLISGLALLGLALVQPLAILSAYAGFGAFLIARVGLRAAGRDPGPISPWALKAGVAVLVSLPLVLYFAVGTLIDPSLGQWAAQNILTSPHPVHYLVAYALVLIPAAIGARSLTRTSPPLGWFLVAWLAVLFLLAYAPVTVQRRLIEGAWVALSVLAAAGLASVPIGVRRQRQVANGLMAASLLTSILLLGGGLGQVLRPSMPLFRPASEVAAFGWIADHAAPGSVVLTSFETGNALPAWAPVRSVIGHGPETANLAVLEPLVSRFFSGDLRGAPAERLLDEQRVAFVLRGPIEEAIGRWEAPPSDRMAEVFDESGYVIYAVARDDD